jgi:L-threonylcarbamoyladenylate synthase
LQGADMAKTFSLANNYDEALAEAKRILKAGGTLVYPTDTLYGLGCNALSEKAVGKIYALKGREEGKPLSIIVSDHAMLLEYCTVSSAQEKILHALLPGPYTFILPLRKKLPVSATMEIGIRVPEHMFMRQVSKELGIPVVSTSANVSGDKDAASLSSVSAGVSSRADLLIDGGKCQYGTGSTVIDLIGMKVLRKGAIKKGDRIEFG